MVQANSKRILNDNWESLIRRLPFKRRIQDLPRADAAPQVFYSSGDFGEGRHWNNPLARKIEAMGGHSSGGAGCS